MSYENAPGPQLTLEEQRLAVFPKVAEFASNPDNEFAAGPDITNGTGLSRGQIQALNYGGYSELKTDALAWKAEADIKAAGQVEIDKRNEVAQSRLDGVNEYWVATKLADGRVDAISYREKLLHGGESGLQRRPGLAEKIRRDAIDTAESEGLSVGHLKTAEKVPSMAQVLREHDRNAVRSVAQTQDNKPNVVTDAAQELREDFQNEVINPDYDEALEIVKVQAKAALAADEKAGLVTDADDARGVAVSEQQHRSSLRGRAGLLVRKSLSKAGKIADKLKDVPHKVPAVLTTRAASAREYLSDKEHGRKRKVITALGTTALLIGGGLLMAKGLDVSGHTAPEAAAGLAGKAGRAHNAVATHGTVGLADLAPKGAGHGAQAHESLLDSVKIGKGARPYDVLHDAGVSDPMGALDRAAKESGLDYHWHGQGAHRYLEVAGKTDTVSVVASLKKFIKA